MHSLPVPVGSHGRTQTPSWQRQRAATARGQLLTRRRLFSPALPHNPSEPVAPKVPAVGQAGPTLLGEEIAAGHAHLQKNVGNYRWTIPSLLIFATTINYMDRRVLSLTWKDFIVPEFHWTNSDYSTITALLKDRAFATSLWNAGATVGALAALLVIPTLAQIWGWEVAFIIISALGFVWMIFLGLRYEKPEAHPKIRPSELAHIQQDKDDVPAASDNAAVRGKASFTACLRYPQTWAFAIGKLLTDGVWWFLLFWTPAYLSAVYNIKSSDGAGKLAIFTLYIITLLSIVGGWLPGYFVGKKGMNPCAGRMRAMLLFAFFPLLALLAQPLGRMSYWWPVLIIGIAGAAHQAWSANLFSTVSDMFSRKAVATITGIGGMAGGIGAFTINKSSGVMFDHARKTGMVFLGFRGEEAGYFIIFSLCAVAYLLAWVVIKTLVP